MCKSKQVWRTILSAFGSWNEYFKQIVTTNHKKERGRITREKLAQVVAKRVKTYLEELEVSEK